MLTRILVSFLLSCLPVLAWAAPEYPRSFLWGAFLYENQNPALHEVESLAEVGVNAVQVDLHWSTLEPRPGEFDEEAIARKREQLIALRARGIRPLLSLHRLSHPAWFLERGGWLSPDSPRFFLRYAQTLVSRLGDLCDLWITFDEAMVLVVKGYLRGEISPGQSSRESAFEAAFQIARAHRMAAAHIHEVQGHSPNARGEDGQLRGVGLTLTESSQGHWIRGIQAGAIQYESRRRSFPSQDLPPWDPGALIDWIGVVPGKGPENCAPTPAQNPPAEDLEASLRQLSRRFSLPLAILSSPHSAAALERLETLDRVQQSGEVDLRGFFPVTGNSAREAYAQAIRARRQVRPGRRAMKLDPYPDAYRDGYVITLWGETASPEANERILDRIERETPPQARWLTLPIFGCQTALSSADVGACQVQSREAVFAQARQAQARGFRVAFLPILTTPDWQWRGFFEPEDVSAWFQSYAAWLLEIAREAQEQGHSELVVGSEFKQLFVHASRWRELIRQVRQVFSGAIVVTANWDSLDYGFWDAVDAIGVSAYAPLSSSPQPTDAELDRSWSRLKTQYVAMADRWGKPLHLTEVGYPNARHAAEKPWWVDSQALPDPELQRRCFESFRRVWAQERRLVRAAIWSAEDESHRLLTGHDPLGRPASESVRAFIQDRLKLLPAR